MDNREKVIKGLECCRNGFCLFCPYNEHEIDAIKCKSDLNADALALLKAQEPVEPIAKNRAYFCGNPCCGRILADMVPSGAPTHKIKYCSECGQAVKWE